MTNVRRLSLALKVLPGLIAAGLLLVLQPAATAQTAPSTDPATPPAGHVAQGTITSAAAGYVLMEIQPGTFQMGSPDTESGREPDEVRHEVRITKPFWLGQKEVTQAQWKEIMGTEPFVATYMGVSFLDPRFPAEGISWLDAVTFCNKLSARDGLTPAYTIQGTEASWNRSANGYRLPTEAEWEYAARAGTTTIYTKASGYGSVCGYGNVADATARRKFPSWSGAVPCADGHVGLAPVGSYKPNDWGLYDMTGNVSEWVWDRYAPYNTALADDPSGPDTGEKRVYRGGSWTNNHAYSRLAARGKGMPEKGDISFGFRVARY
jgi:formylglycine-generating enzyme